MQDNNNNNNNNSNNNDNNRLGHINPLPILALHVLYTPNFAKIVAIPKFRHYKFCMPSNMAGHKTLEMSQLLN